MPTTEKKSRTKCQPRLAFCPVGILSTHHGQGDQWHFFLARRELNFCVIFMYIKIRFVIIIIFVPAQGPPVDQGPKPGWRHLPKYLNTHRPPKSQQNKFCAPVLIRLVLVQCFDITLSPWMGGFVCGWPTLNDGCLRVGALWLQVLS